MQKALHQKMRTCLQVALCALVLAFWTITVSASPDGGPDCDAEPLVLPSIEIAGAAEVGGVDRLNVRLNVQGRITDLRVDRAAGFVTVGDARQGQVTFAWKLPRSLPVDLTMGRSVTVAYRYGRGFGGEARGLVVADEAGPVLILEDGAYGNALSTAERAPFEVFQADAGCRNRENRPGDLNNAFLVVTAEGQRIQLIHGQQKNLIYRERRFAVLAIKSTARVGDVIWTDAPYAYTAFAIVRRPEAVRGTRTKQP